MGLLTAFWFEAYTLQFSPLNVMVISLQLQAGKQALVVVCAYVDEYPAFLECLDGALEGFPSG